MMLPKDLKVCLYYCKKNLVGIIIHFLEYKLSQESPKELPRALLRESPRERQLTITDVFDDNSETDKHQSSTYDRLLSGKFLQMKKNYFSICLFGRE